MPKVIMSSAEYGDDELVYDNEEEAKAGFERLKVRCLEHFQKDNIERKLILSIDEWSTNDE